jgi:hypothetical protein
MPIGAIMIWKGTDADVPTGWHICDGGTYGGYATPDLRDRFVKGAGGDYAVNSTGGPATWNGTITPTGTVTVGDHVLTNAELPVHSHSYTEYHNPVARSSGSGSGYPNVDSYWDSPVGEQSTGGGSHGHTGSSIAFSGVDPRPLYYALYYIMKVA